MPPIQVARVHLDMEVLKAMIRKEPEQTRRLVAGMAFAVQGEAATRAPVDTSALANSIQAVPVSTYHWRVQDGVHYGVYQELGFIHYISGAWIQNPFMVPAVEAHRARFEMQAMHILSP